MAGPPKLKHLSDVRWDKSLKGYLVRVLAQPDGKGGFEAHPRDLVGVESGYGATEKDAIEAVKANLRDKITPLHGEAIPWVEILHVRKIGARDVKCLIVPKTEADDAAPSPE